MTEDDDELAHQELHVDTEYRVRHVLKEALSDPACRAHVLATLLREEIRALDDVEDLQDIFSMLGMMVFERAVSDQHLMHPVGSA